MKKNKIIIKTICSILIIAVMMTFTGCGFTSNEKSATALKDMPIEKSPSFSYDIIGGNDVMPIMGFYGPRPNDYSYNANVLPDYYSDEFFDLINETGVNFIGTTYTKYHVAPSYVYKLLEQGEKHNVGITVWDDKLFEEGITLEQLDERINNYSSYPAFCGLYLVDEPGTPSYRAMENSHNIDEFTDVVKLLNQLNCPFYANIFGMRNTDDRETYTQYVKEFADTLQPKYLLYDRYIFNTNTGLEFDWLHFQNLETIRNQAETSNIPFWLFVQAGAQWNDAKEYFDSTDYWPSKGEFLWMGNTGLAFGAKGLAYFPMLQPYWFAYSKTEPFDFQRNGLIGAAGNKTRWFYYAKQLSAQVKAIDEVLMNATNKGVIASGNDAEKALKDNKYVIKEASFREVKAVSGDAVVGCFNYNGKTALYVVNYDIKYAQKIKLELNSKCKFDVTQESKTNYLSDDEVVLELGAGDGALVVFK